MSTWARSMAGTGSESESGFVKARLDREVAGAGAGAAEERGPGWARAKRVDKVESSGDKLTEA